MNNSKFRSIPESTNFKIPFKLDEPHLAEWFNNLSQYDNQEACVFILRLIQALNATNLAVSKRILFLKIIANHLKTYIFRLKGACWDSGFPLSMTEIIYAELVTWNYLLLGEGFFLAAEQSNKKEDEIFCLAMALHAMGQAQLHIAAVYAVPSDGFWSLVYKIYSLAEKNKLADEEVNNILLKGITLTSLFKKMLIFQLCDNTQFRPRDMRTIFEVIDRVCINATIDKSIAVENREGMFMLDLNSDQPPINVNHSKKKFNPLSNSSIRYFSSVNIARDIYMLIKQGKIWAGTKKSVNNSLFRRVIKTLGLKTKRKYRRLHDDHNVLGVIGFDNIIDFLYRKNTAIDLSQLKQITDDDVWNQYFLKEADVKRITIFDSSAKGYSVYWHDVDLKTQIGDVAGIISDDTKRLEIVLIRRIAMSLGRNFRFGVEIIGFESEVVYVTEVDGFSAGIWAIFIPGIKPLKQADTLIYSDSTFKLGDRVCINRKNHEPIYCQLAFDLHSTTTIHYIEIAY